MVQEFERITAVRAHFILPDGRIGRLRKGIGPMARLTWLDALPNFNLCLKSRATTSPPSVTKT
jgi:hypothetical protein